MRLIINNPQPIIPADARKVGAAIKIILAGGSNLAEQKAARASGLSAYVWSQDGAEILDLVKQMER